MSRSLCFVGAVSLAALAAGAWIGVERLGDDRRAAGLAGSTYAQVLEQLGPETTLHTLRREYRRPPEHAEQQPDALRLPPAFIVEGWLSFDDTGALREVRGLTQGLDGRLYEEVRPDGDDIVYLTGEGVEFRRLQGGLGVANIDRMKAGLSEAYAEGASALDAQPDARRETVDGVDVRVVESQVRLPSASSYVPSNDPSQYQLRAVGNLQPIKVIHRHYISVAEGREIKYEVVVVDAEGREEVLESSETVLVEVLTP